MIVINFSGSKANAHALNLTWTTYIYTNITHRESMIICMVPPPLRHRVPRRRSCVEKKASSNCLTCGGAAAATSSATADVRYFYQC